MSKLTLFLFILLGLFSCKSETLPYLGMESIDEEGTKVRHQVQPFQFINQDSVLITETYLKGKITVVDFFFSTCPTICPIMTNNMVVVQQQWQHNEQIQFLSHTVDPETDTPARLKTYAKRKEANTANWQFVTGEKSKLYEAGVHSYLVSTSEDVLAPGGFLHSELFVLVDEDLHLRGVYDGTKDEEIEKLNQDIKILLNE